MDVNQTLDHKDKLKRLGRTLLRRNELGTILPLVILLVTVGIVNKDFFAIGNIMDIGRTASFSFMVAVPMTFLLSTGSMDLSIGAVTSFGGVICAFALEAGFPIPLAIALALFAGACVGLVNGLIVVRYDMPPFITTLGTQYVVKGIIMVATSGLAISGFSDTFKRLAQGRAFGVVPYTIFYAVVIGIIGHVVLTRTKHGRAILAIGGNRETAYLAGINVTGKRIGAYIINSTFAAFAGVMMASRFASAQPEAGTGTEMTIMASVIIGGTSSYGGTGTVIGSALGCILLATILNALIVMGVSAFWQNLIFGLILLVSLFIDKYRRQVGAGK